MEETREFAALDMHNPLMPISGVLGQGPSPVAPREYVFDSSEKYEKSKNKLIYAATFSLVVGLFSISSETNLIGLKLEGLTDRRLEWMAWLAAVFFAVNTMLRYFDERRTPEMYLKEVQQLQGAFAYSLDRIKETNKRCLEEMDAQSDLAKRIAKLKEQLHLKMMFEPKSLLSPETETFVKKSLTELIEKLDDLIRTYGWTVEEVEKLPLKLRKFEKKVKANKKYRNISGFRFFIFDVLMPLSLFLVATIFQFSPQSKVFILSLVPA